MKLSLKGLLILMACFFSGCVNQLAQMSNRLSKVEVGMSEADVVLSVGKPTSVAAKEGIKIYNYKLYTTTSAAVMDGTPENFYVIFKDGVVSAYGGAAELNAISK